MRELARMRLRRTRDMKDTLATLRAAADGGGDQRGGRLDEAEGDRRQLTADLELLQLQLDEALAECVLLADRTGQPERVVALRALLEDTTALESEREATPPPRVEAAKVVLQSVSPPVTHTAPTAATAATATTASLSKPSLLSAGGPTRAELEQSLAVKAGELAAAEAELESALADDNYEAAEQLDPRIEALKNELVVLNEAIANAPAPEAVSVDETVSQSLLSTVDAVVDAAVDVEDENTVESADESRAVTVSPLLNDGDDAIVAPIDDGQTDEGVTDDLTE